MKMTNFNKFLKLVPKLPIMLQILLLLPLALLWLLTQSFVIVSVIILVCVLFLYRHKLKVFVEHFVEQKDQEINRVIGKIEIIHEELKLKLQSDNSDNSDNRENLLESQSKLENIIKNLQTSRDSFHDAIAIFNESISGLNEENQKFNKRINALFSNSEKSNKQPKLPVLLAKRLSEDWCSDLEELQSHWVNSGCSALVVQLRTIKCLVEMGWAKLMIRWQDYLDSKTTQQINDK
ncbi:hypothetical protein NIES4074_27890 [Cylindrospermum sp. NIES-4074]|nr:hypothetical protein NIES4074_27890 [Cylindrospermum sp. NIES-4074]